MIDYAQILSTNYVGKQWSLNGDSYDGLDWLDSSPKPTQAELDALWQSTQDQVAKNACKATAKAKLAASDWSALPDVNLTNKSDFVAYRANLRNLVLNPVTNPNFGTEPTPVWSNA
jgi:hypothetical protein